jgi:hypothetical protein
VTGAGVIGLFAAVWSVLDFPEGCAMEVVSGLAGARLPGEAPGAAGAAFGAPVGAGELESVLLLEPEMPFAGAIVFWPVVLPGAILPGEALDEAGAFGAPVGAGAEVVVCAMAKPVDMIRAAEAIKSDRMCVSCETDLFLSRHVGRRRSPHKKVCLNS